MKALIIIALLGVGTLIAHAQTPAYHEEINNVPVRDTIPATFREPVHGQDATKYDPVAYAGKMMSEYKNYHLTGSFMEITGATMVVLNLVEMNRTSNPRSGYTPLFVVGGSVALAGYVIDHFIAPGFIEQAGIALQGNTISIALGK